MPWMLLVALVWFAVCSADTTSRLPDDVLNNLAALHSAENILVNIDDLTSVPDTSTVSLVATTAVSEKKSTKQPLKITLSQPLEPGRRFAAGPPAASRYNSDIKGLEVLYEMKRRIQKHVQNMMQAESFSPISSLRLTEFAPEMQYKDPKLISYPYYGLPPRFEAAQQPGNKLNPLDETKNSEEYAKQLSDLKLVAAFVDYTHPVPKPHEQNFVYRQAPNSPPQPEPRETLLSFAPPGLRSKNTAPASKTIPEWMLRELAEMRRARRPNVKMAAESSTISQAEVEAAFLEARAKMMTRPGWREPQPPFPTSFTPVNILPARPLLPQRPMLAVSLPPLPVVSPPLPLVSKPPKNFVRTARPRAAITSNRYKVVSATNNIPSDKLLKLMAFMRENREALLQFITLKRNQLVKRTMNVARNGATLGRNGLNNVGRTRFLGRLPVMEALVRGNGANSNALNSVKGYGGDKGFGKGLTASGVSAASQPVIRALPADYPAHRLDLAPGRGKIIDHLRIKDRLCQRNVMQVAGPKYDSRANVKTREFLPGVDRRAFRVTRRKRLLLPACCNCCKKSVLGCQ